MWTLEQAARELGRLGQQHVLHFARELSPEQLAGLLGQLEVLDFELVRAAIASPAQPVDTAAVTPYDRVVLPTDQQAAEARHLGVEACRDGRVGTLLVAGGEGSRLGFEGPKGAFPIGAVSGRTLFQLHAERLVAIGRRHGVVPPLYVMTSPGNHDRTAALFAEAGYYGMPPERVLIFAQGVAPALDEQGRLLLADRDRLVLAPSGNGGLFAALRDSGAFDHMRACGVDTISYVQVDNALARACDERFVGYHLLSESEFSCKAIAKLDAREAVGNFARVAGKLGIVEYTEIPEELATQCGPGGKLLFGYGNPGLFIWSRAFAEAQAARRDLPIHRAHKKVRHLTLEGKHVEPTAPNAYKLETFALDTLPDARRSLVLACEREEEFAPVKNATGNDSPASARALMTRLYRGWIESGGGTVRDGVALEISPLYALDADELARRGSLHIECDTYLAP